MKVVAAQRAKEEAEMKELELALLDVEDAHKAECTIRNKARSQRITLEKEIRTLKQALKKLTTKAGKMELDLKAAEQNLPDLERNAAELKEQTVVSAEEKAQISTLSRQVSARSSCSSCSFIFVAGDWQLEWSFLLLFVLLILLVQAYRSRPSARPPISSPLPTPPHNTTQHSSSNKKSATMPMPQRPAQAWSCALACCKSASWMSGARSSKTPKRR
jgi:hypothetical protein